MQVQNLKSLFQSLHKGLNTNTGYAHSAHSCGFVFYSAILIIKHLELTILNANGPPCNACSPYDKLHIYKLTLDVVHS